MITDKHREFARAVVRLAQEHQMDNIRISYRNRISILEDVEGGYEEVTLTWCEGRHGVPSVMRLETRASEMLDE